MGGSHTYVTQSVPVNAKFPVTESHERYCEAGCDKGKRHGPVTIGGIGSNRPVLDSLAEEPSDDRETEIRAHKLYILGLFPLLNRTLGVR